MSDHSAVMSKSIVYDGEDYTRDNLETMVKDYAEKHETRIGELEELKKTHDTISREMTDELAEQKTVWDCVKDMTSGEKGAVSANMRLLLERIPMLKDRLPDRPLSELLQQKIHVTETRIREVGGFLDRMESEIEKIDARRAEAAESGGDHDRLRYGFLSPAEVPDGFLACAEMRDVMVLYGSDIRNDRFHLHCWNLNPKAGTAVQALISMIEFNPLDVPVSSALQEDYTRLRETF